MERKALGKGISALIPEKNTGREEKIIYAPIEKIKPSPFQPRSDFDNQNIEELARSIKEKGIIQPLLVRHKGADYELIAGERRLRAANILNLKELPIIVKETDDPDALELSLIENIQRQDLNPIEEARAYRYLIDKFQITQEKISAILGKSRASTTNSLRLLKLPQEIQEEIRKERISFAHGRALLEIDDQNKQRKLAQQVIAQGLSVRELESLIKSSRSRGLRLRKAQKAQEPYVTFLEEELQHLLATKVRIIKKKKRGYIFIEFYSQEDLDRIMDKLRGAKEDGAGNVNSD